MLPVEKKEYVKGSNHKSVFPTQAATMKGILRIVQSIPSRKAEPLKQWLAELGRSVISSAKASDYISPSQEPELLEGGDNNKE